MFTLFLFFLAQRMPGKWICAFLRALPALTWLPVLRIVRDIWMSAGHVSFKVIARGAAEWKSEEQSQRGEEGGHNPKRIGSSPPYTHTHTLAIPFTQCVCVFQGVMSTGWVSWFRGSGVWFLRPCRSPCLPLLFAFLMSGAGPRASDWHLQTALSQLSGIVSLWTRFLLYLMPNDELLLIPNEILASLHFLTLKTYYTSLNRLG